MERRRYPVLWPWHADLAGGRRYLLVSNRPARGAGRSGGLSVVEGERLESRAVLGEVGQTGRTTGPHLHFGLRWRGARVDPALLLGPTAEIPVLSESADPANSDNQADQ